MNSLGLSKAPRKRRSTNQLGNPSKRAETVASRLQTPPRQVTEKEGTSQEVLASEDKEHQIADPDILCRVPRKRRSGNTLDELGRTEKDSGDNDVLIKSGGDKGQIELVETRAQFTQMTLDREERVKTKGYVEKKIGEEKVKRLGNLRICMLCGGKIQWVGKCQECVEARCRVWLEEIRPEDEYLSILDGLVEQNQDRLTKAEEMEEAVAQNQLNAIE